MKINQNQIQMEKNIVSLNNSNSSPNSNEEFSTNDSMTINNRKYSTLKKIINNLDLDQDFDYIEYFVYNSQWNLRKCASKLLDKISCIYSNLTFSILKPFLEVDLQCQDWLKR